MKAISYCGAIPGNTVGVVALALTYVGLGSTATVCVGATWSASSVKAHHLWEKGIKYLSIT